ncbi:MAG TPA: hypothetical protein VNI01_08825 [Elusimicrobiota bacterium]|jgi:hypothetical protein|nr:hypothetical protein [Elusimicrobiota bacterium]
MAEEKKAVSELVGRLEAVLRATPDQTAVQLAKAVSGVTKQQVQKALYGNGPFESRGTPPRWRLRPQAPRCLGGCNATARVRIGGTCFHFSATPNDEALQAVLRAVRLFDSGAVVGDGGELGRRLALLAQGGEPSGELSRPA